MFDHLFSRNNQTDLERSRFEQMRRESIAYASNDRMVMAAFTGMTIIGGICMLLVSIEINSYVPALFFILCSISMMIFYIRTGEEYWQITADLSNLVFNMFYFVITLYYGRVDLVMFWYYAHIVLALMTGGILKGTLSAVLLSIILFSGLYVVSPDIEITRDWSTAIIYANAFVLFFGFMLASNSRINVTFKKLLAERDQAKITTDRLNLTLKHTGMGILDVAADQRVEFSNEMAQNILGNPKEIEGKHFIGLATFKDGDGKPIFSTDNVISNAIANKTTLKNYRINIAETKTDAHIDVVDIEDAGSVVIIRPIRAT